MLSNTLCGTSYICKYRELFGIVNSGFSINRDTKMAVSLSPIAKVHRLLCNRLNTKCNDHFTFESVVDSWGA